MRENGERTDIRMESQDAKRLGGYWHAVSLELDEDEFVPYRGYIFLRGTPAWGELFLTTKRLLWLRMKISLPLGRKFVVIPLGDIQGWSIEPVPWWWLERLGRRRRMIRLRTSSETYDFVTVWTREDADDWVRALETVQTAAREVRRVKRRGKE